MSYQSKPHISQAVQHARAVVSFAALALGICLFLQVVVWAAIHYTDVRTTDLGAGGPDEPSFNVVKEPSKPMVRVVPSQSAASEEAAASDDASLSPQEAGALLDDILSTESESLATAGQAEIDANQVVSAADIVLRRFSDLVQTTGLIAAVVFAMAVFQAMVIAGGAGIPGVEKAVSASSWSIVVAMLCLPLGSIFPSAPYGGVFMSYTQLVEASQAFHSGAPNAPGPMGFFGASVALPFIILGALVLTVLRFRAGVEAGVIVTSVSQLDEKLEQEIRGMKLGQLTAPRAVGALHTAIGDGSSAPPKPMRISPEDELSGTGADSNKPRRLI